MLCPCRALLAALAVSYLMCVLLLSGVQKEDLDASVLNKLQRYNVNIHDLNNNELLHECTTLQLLNNKNKTPQTRGIENEIEKFISKRKSQNEDNHYNLTNVNTHEYDNLNKNVFEKENNKNKHDILYVDGQPELQSVLKFWEDIKINNSIKTTQAPIKLNVVNDVIDDNDRPEQKNKRNIQDGANSNEFEIQKLLLNFLLKNQNKNVDSAVTEKSIHIGEFYNNLNFLNKQSENKNLENNDSAKLRNISPINVEAKKIKQYSLNNISGKNKDHLKILNKDFERENRVPINSNHFNDIINALQSFKTYNPIIPKDKSAENGNPHIKDKITLSKSIYFNKFGEHENILTTEKLITPKTVEQILPENVIKEIAKTVKELVLKDLQKEIFETTSLTTTANLLQTTPSTTERREKITTIKTENQNAERSILNKFMDLFEEIKTLNHKTLIISSEIRKENMKNEESTIPAIPPPIFNDMEQLSYYKIKQYPNANSQKIYNFFPQEHKYRSNIVSGSVLKVPIKSTLPITVQTNNMEIPPLGIPVDIPQNPINQNIIVPTMKPYRTSEHKVDHHKIKFPNARIGEDSIPKQSQIRFSRPKEPTVYYSNHRNDERFSLNKDHSNLNMNFNDKVALDRYKELPHRDDEIKHSDIPRFHEQLERGVDYIDIPRKEYTDRVDCCSERIAYSKQMADCCNRKIASRQQMSLGYVKKQPSYDDTHFKNFLKSQQKVTDMLERILASRSRVRSVETA